MKYTSIPQFFIWHQGKIEWQKKNKTKWGKRWGEERITQRTLYTNIMQERK